MSREVERELAERLGCSAEWINNLMAGEIGYVTGTHARELIGFISELLSSRRWVKIDPNKSETLPEDGQKVWVFIPASGILPDMIEPRIFSKNYPVWHKGATVKAMDVFVVMYSIGYNLPEIISHWMPYYVPSPPEKGATDVTD